MALCKFSDERGPIRRRHLLRWLASAALPLILAACAAKLGATRDPRMGQGSAGHGDGAGGHGDGGAGGGGPR
jgi:hypothetical protein